MQQILGHAKLNKKDSSLRKHVPEICVPLL